MGDYPAVSHEALQLLKIPAALTLTYPPCQLLKAHEIFIAGAESMHAVKPEPLDGRVNTAIIDSVDACGARSLRFAIESSFSLDVALQHSPNRAKTEVILIDRRRSRGIENVMDLSFAIGEAVHHRVR